MQPYIPLTIIMTWLEWRPDAQRTDAQWVKVFHPGSWTPQNERDDPPPRHTYREWNLIMRKMAFNIPAALGTRGTGPRKVTDKLQLLNLMSVFIRWLLLININVATQSSALCLSPQMLEAILRSSDASAFSTEDLTRIQAGICQQLSDRTRHDSHQHQPVRASRGVAPPESIGVADPYLPATQPCSSTNKEKPIWRGLD